MPRNPLEIIGLFIYKFIVVNTSLLAIISLQCNEIKMIMLAAKDLLYLISPMLKDCTIALGISKCLMIVMISYSLAKTIF